MVRASAARKSPPRRQGVLGAAGLLLAAAIAIPHSASRAQTPAPDAGTQAADTGSDLLQPKLQGSPRTLPRFRRPGEPTPPRGNQPPPTGKFTAPSRIGATPIYGSPPALGAGETGYDSTNNRRRKKPAQPSTTSAGTPAGAPPQPQTTFTPVPTYARATPPKKARGKETAAAAGGPSAQSRSTARCDIAAARRAPAGEPSAARAASVGGGEAARRRAAGSAADPRGDALQYAASWRAAAQHPAARNGAAAAVADRGG